MTGRVKGRLAVLGLVLLLGGFGVALATTKAARVRFWTWRLRQGDLVARDRLLEIGRPEIDRALPELVAWEVLRRVAITGYMAESVHGTDGLSPYVFVGRFELPRVSTFTTFPYVVESVLLGTSGDRVWIPPTAGSDERDETQAELDRVLGRSRRVLVVATDGPHAIVEVNLAIPLPEDDPVSAAIIEETRARLAGFER